MVISANLEDRADALFGELAEHADAAAYGRDGWQGLMDGLTSVLPGVSGGFVRQPLSRGADVPLGIMAGFEDGFARSFEAHYHAVNPFAPVMAGLRAGQVVVANTFLPIPVFRHTEFVADWVAPQSLMNSTNVKLAGTRHSVAWISLHYDDGAADRYDVLLERLVRRLTGRLTRAVATGDRLAASADAGLCTASLLGHETEIALVIDGAGLILDANAPGERALMEGHVLREVRRRLFLRDAGARDWLSRALRQDEYQRDECHQDDARDAGSIPYAYAISAGEDTPPLDAGSELARPGRSGLLLHLAPLPSLVHDTWPAALQVRRRYLLLARRSEASELLDGQGLDHALARFGHRHGLTAAELRLCRELVGDHNLFEAAARLGITRNTARDRLKTIFRKSGVSRQAALIRALLLA